MEKSQIDPRLLHFHRNVQRCLDYDEPTAEDNGCDGVRDHTNCYLYDPEKGYCPYIHQVN
jgi:hypothetical protein